jgi:hypothetical protein
MLLELHCGIESITFDDIRFDRDRGSTDLAEQWKGAWMIGLVRGLQARDEQLVRSFPSNQGLVFVHRKSLGTMGEQDGIKSTSGGAIPCTVRDHSPLPTPLVRHA